ncbi:MAG TPA: ABC transporter ATP-binding protein [bacterium]|nr:ABC transporter ATP-binding protein [bacterium]HPN43952.1 ABC transporter ATP-binding protein [bacterium]
MNSSIIKVEDVSVYYDNFCALEDIEFKCQKGEFVVIVGKSGVGKSSFLNALAYFIEYHGKIIRPQHIGYVFQNYSLFPWMTVSQNIGYGLENINKKNKQERINDMLHKIDMVEYKNRYPSQLSGGQIQRVALARALAPDPDLLLMDEPYASLDYHTRDKMQEWLLSVWQNSRKTIIFVTHYIDEAIFLADRILVLKNKAFIHEEIVPFNRPRNNEIRYLKEFITLKHTILNFME